MQHPLKILQSRPLETASDIIVPGIIRGNRLIWKLSAEELPCGKGGGQIRHRKPHSACRQFMFTVSHSSVMKSLLA